MGAERPAHCRGCDHEFMVSEGGGFFFHLLHCDRCGEDISVPFDEIDELHTRYLKGQRGPHAVISAEHDRYVREQVDVEPISGPEYFAAVETFAGRCSCGGQFRFDAPHRCPKCRSTDIELGPEMICYD